MKREMFGSAGEGRMKMYGVRDVVYLGVEGSCGVWWSWWMGLGGGKSV